MKILFLCRVAKGRHGVQTQWLYFFRRFAQTEHIPFCFVSRKCYLEKYLRDVAVPFKVLPWRGSGRIGRVINALAFPRIVRFARRFDPDVIEGDINDFPLLRLLSKKTKAAIVCRVRSHDVFTRDLSDSAFVDKFIPLSRRLAAPLLRAGVPEEKIEIINDGVDVGHFASDNVEPCEDTSLRVGIVGRIDPFKRIMECLHVARVLKAGGTPFSFSFVGGTFRPAYVREVMAEREALGLKETCHFVPETGDMREFYRSIDVLLTLSGGSVMLEAMAMGKPVVAASPVSRTEHSIVEHGQTGFLYDQDDFKGVAEGLRTLAGSRELARKLGNAGREKVVSTFDIEALIGRTLDLYQGLAPSKN